MKGRMGEEENGRAGRHQGVTVLPHGEPFRWEEKLCRSFGQSTEATIVA